MRLTGVLFATARVIRDVGSPRLRAAGRLNKAAISLTPNAIERIKELMAERPEMTALRIGVKERGCNGLTYTLDYVNTKEKFDEEIQQDGVRLLIDVKAQMSVLGSEMDYVEDRLASEFVFHNPNIKGTCGCGESFNM